MTAMGWSAAAAGVTSRPVSGSLTRAGVGTGVGVGLGVGEGEGDGLTPGVGLVGTVAEAPAGLGFATRPVAGDPLGAGDEGEQAATRNRQATANRT
jgi:hypothetical protein